MTEHEWLAQELVDPGDFDVLLGFLRGKVSDRKLRLFACGCTRFVEDLRTDRSALRAVEVAERFADGLASAEERDAALHALPSAIASVITPSGFIPSPVAAALWPDAMLAAEHAARTVTTDCYGCYVAYPGVEKDMLNLFRDIVGPLPFRSMPLDPAWLTTTVQAIAQAVYTDRAFDRLPILADALEDAGCTNADVLNHCRQPGAHARGCWALDLVLDKK
jgi:hypothetical protein